MPWKVFFVCGLLWVFTVSKDIKAAKMFLMISLFQCLCSILWGKYVISGFTYLLLFKLPTYLCILLLSISILLPTYILMIFYVCFQHLHSYLYVYQTTFYRHFLAEIYYVHEMNSPMHLGMCTFCTINFSGAINIMQKVVILQVLDLGKRAGGRLTVSTKRKTKTIKFYVF